MSISRRVRFSVFEAANFTCAYCGRKPPAVILECDHIHPQSKGGKDAKSNLLCSCRDCNRGKGAKELGVAVPDQVMQNAVDAKERLAQLRAIRRYEEKIDAMVGQAVDRLQHEWFQVLWDMDDRWGWTNVARSSIRQFLTSGCLSERDIRVALGFAARKFRGKNSSDAWPYLCGICWRWIRDGGREAHNLKKYGVRQ